jgi:WD40 repeat protein
MRKLSRYAVIFCYILITVTGVSHAPAQVAEIPNGPFLRVETGMHTGGIKRIASDGANRFVATVSRDKTLRIWALDTGRLVRIIRPPIGDGNEGKLYAVAVSPDGSTVATGGYAAAYATEGSESIYLFSREHGTVVGRIRGIPEIIYDLAYSPDGRFLAVGLGAHFGIRVFDTHNNSLVGEDTDYGDSCLSVEFTASGKLATASDDGSVRLYDVDEKGAIRRRAITKPPGGSDPLSARFSPDGTKVAVGFGDSPAIQVLSGDDLSVKYAPSIEGAGATGPSDALAWSSDGASLYGSFSYTATGNSVVRVWADGGRGRYRDITVAGSGIMEMVALRAGGMVYGSADAFIGAVDVDGAEHVLATPATAEMSGNRQGLLTSADGSKVQFSYRILGKEPARFSIADRTLELEPPSSPSMLPPVTTSTTVVVTDWSNNYFPKVNGKKVPMQAFELAGSIAILRGSAGVLIGTNFHIRFIDGSGDEVWRTPTPESTTAVNASSDGKLAIATFADGTIRWYRMTDGKELLAFFPHKDRKRWILWTPSGYFDASPGAEELIGWHVNNGRDAAADFFPLAQFRDTYYRPDVISKILTTLDEQAAVKQANAERGVTARAAAVEDLLPPVVDIISPSDGSKLQPGEITVKYRVRSPTGDPVTGIMAMVDGKTAAVERGLNLNVGANGIEREIKVRVPDGASLISLLAINRNAPSAASVVQVRTAKDRGAEIPGQPPPPPSARPRLYVLAIGVGKYAAGSGLPVLAYPAKDARDFAAAFEKQKGRGYQEVVEKVLPDATHDDVVDGLDWITKTTTDKDVAMIFLAGHGITDGGDFYYFMPSDSNLEQPKRRGVAFSEIENTLVSLKGQKVLFVDTCRSGAVLGKRGIIDINGIANKLNRETSGVAVFTASMGNESAEESSTWGNGAFTRALLDGLSGKADFDGSGEISFSMLDRFLTRRVREMTSNRQTPTATKPLTVPDFLLAMTR